jgi:hypothetical protein
MSLIEEVRFASDSPLEESGFEPPVPPAKGKLFNCAGSLRATSGVQFLGEGMAKSELGAKPRSPLILH